MCFQTDEINVLPESFSQDQAQKDSESTYKCPLGVFPAPAFVADFPPVAPEFHQRTHRVRLRNLGTTDKKSSHKIRYRKIPREHIKKKEKDRHEICSHS